MNIEEKAKRYDEAIERARAINNGEDVDVEAGITTCEYIFPELKESEDEEIRKWLVEELYKSVNSSISKGFDINMGRKALAWLEKQGNLMKALQISNARIGELIEKNYYLKEQLEKQGEQKPVDKAETKFHKVDWINGYYTNYKVLSVNNEGYEVEDTDGNKINILFENEKFHHLWTIQDAKDGDVLTTDMVIFIFKENKEGSVFMYCNYSVVSNSFSISNTAEVNEIYVHPATKEQHDLLFQKMKESGYEWDAEKKELKKIEQNSTWSEEDEKMFDYALDMIEWYSGKNEDRVNLVRNWLLSLKERYTWKPSDEQMKAFDSVLVYNPPCSNECRNHLITLYNDLEKLRKE